MMMVAEEEEMAVIEETIVKTSQDLQVVATVAETEIETVEDKMIEEVAANIMAVAEITIEAAVLLVIREEDENNKSLSNYL